MFEDPVNVFWTFFGILVWPELTLCVILWKLNHVYLAICALLLASTTTVKKIVKKKIVTKEKIVDSRTGTVISERKITTED